MYITNQTPLAESFSVDKIDMLSHTHRIYRQTDTTKTVEKTVDAYLSESPPKKHPLLSGIYSTTTIRLVR
jgi:hypothetical protein